MALFNVQAAAEAALIAAETKANEVLPQIAAGSEPAVQVTVAAVFDILEAGLLVFCSRIPLLGDFVYSTIDNPIKAIEKQVSDYIHSKVQVATKTKAK